MQRHSSGCPRLPRTGSRRIGAGAAVVFLAVTLGQTGATPPQDRGPDPEAFAGIPWQSLEELPQGLAAVRRGATIESRTDRQKALSAIADDPALSARSRAAASYRLGADALRRGRWTEAEKRLTVPPSSPAVS